MAWKIDKKKAKFKEISDSSQETFDTFKDLVHKKGLHPVEAAKKAGDCKYDVLNKKTGQAEIRLSGKDRATFIVDDKTETCTILQVGGHT